MLILFPVCSYLLLSSYYISPFIYSTFQLHNFNLVSFYNVYLFTDIPYLMRYFRTPFISLDMLSFTSLIIFKTGDLMSLYSKSNVWTSLGICIDFLKIFVLIYMPYILIPLQVFFPLKLYILNNVMWYLWRSEYILWTRIFFFCFSAIFCLFYELIL